MIISFIVNSAKILQNAKTMKMITYTKRQLYIIISFLLFFQYFLFSQINMQSVKTGISKNGFSSFKFFSSFFLKPSTDYPLPSPSLMTVAEMIEKIGGVTLVPDLLPAIISIEAVNTTCVSLKKAFNIATKVSDVTAISPTGATFYCNQVVNLSETVDQLQLNGGHRLTILLMHALTCLVGVTGNLLVIGRWWAAKKKTKMDRSFSDGSNQSQAVFRLAANHHRQPQLISAFFISLVVANLFIFTILLPLKTAKYLLVTWDYQRHLCRLNAFIELLSAAVFVFTFLAIFVERCLLLQLFNKFI